MAKKNETDWLWIFFVSIIFIIVLVGLLGLALSWLAPCCSIPVTYDSVMKDGLKKIQQVGYGNTDPVKVNFKKDSVFDVNNFVGALPVDPKNIGFNCKSSDDFCSKNFDLGNNHVWLYANANVAAFVVVCGDSSHSTTLKYCAGVGSTGKDANDACMECLSFPVRS